MIPGVPAVILAAGLLVGDYSFFVPGERQWCWEAAAGDVVGYRTEVYSSHLDAATFSTLMGIEPCALVNHNFSGEWLVRVQAFDGEDNDGPWSEWSEGYEVRANMDCVQDGEVGIPDFNCFREVYGQCVDEVGYHACAP